MKAPGNNLDGNKDYMEEPPPNKPSYRKNPLKNSDGKRGNWKIKDMKFLFMMFTYLVVLMNSECQFWNLFDNDIYEGSFDDVDADPFMWFATEVEIHEDNRSDLWGNARILFFGKNLILMRKSCCNFYRRNRYKICF